MSNYQILQKVLDEMTKSPDSTEELLVDVLAGVICGNTPINSRDSDRHSKSYTPLLMAIENQNMPVIKALVESGADVCRNNGGHDGLKTTPLIEAVEQDNIEILDFLLKNGAEPTIPSAFFYALERDRLPMVNLLFDILVKEKGANPAVLNMGLLSATKASKSHELITKLLTAGADVNYTNKDGSTLLEIYVKADDVKMVESLVNSGADINGATSSQQSPLALAAERCNISMVISLIELGANIELARGELKDFAAQSLDFAIYLDSFLNRDLYSKVDKSD